MSALEMRAQSPSSTSLADLLERVLDKGIVIAGDVQVNLLDIELLTLKLQLIIASADTARSMGIDWWEYDPALSSRAREGQLVEENRELRERLDRLERAIRGAPRRHTCRSDRDGVLAAAVLPPQPPPGALEGAD